MYRIFKRPFLCRSHIAGPRELSIPFLIDKKPTVVPGGSAREWSGGKGIVINGLPIMVKEPSYSTMDIDNLDFYYEDCVIGGPGSFVVTIKDREKFKEAIRTKLLLEVAGRTPERRPRSRASIA